MRIKNKKNIHRNITMHKEDPLSVKYPDEYIHLLKQHAVNMQEENYSTQALDIITSIIYYCPTNYTVWVDRRKVLGKIPRDTYNYNKELTWIKKRAHENQKNYQVWHHFKHVLTEMNHEISEDLDILEIVRKDPKNIHFWGVFLACAKNVESALEYTKYFIEEDVRNNSAYSIRYTLISPILKQDPARFQKEKEFLLSLPVLKYNLAYWNYLAGLNRMFPESDLLVRCEGILESKEVPKYYED
ncbi:uncharacterized protein NESG_01238 [Nematocida ausubeli]|uniref:Protein farnesyltransferase/geranylgeranyltransferase type-1 subunit alpha n=1 Tax=Nematocida ausubeli (strain ATCC PRA-371 / ERTm2) TaxID=1913371 RepID=A0A086J1V5_NEMA1|nr:uncharacterized protein NESG_01238 [Nematocida ausubeli]KAI5149650.1 protein farnesyltransferase/geranylgeranyltransferase type-1 subunit alpha [Nematocida ausubeli]KFG26123.1 hypothetical protein NESG_01238 [Nematocida ausubeli]